MDFDIRDRARMFRESSLSSQYIYCKFGSWYKLKTLLVQNYNGLVLNTFKTVW